MSSCLNCSNTILAQTPSLSLGPTVAFVAGAPLWLATTWFYFLLRLSRTAFSFQHIYALWLCLMDTPSSHQLSPASGADTQALALGDGRGTPSFIFILSFGFWPFFKAWLNPSFTTQPHATPQLLLSAPFAELSQHLSMIPGVETFVRKAYTALDCPRCDTQLFF